MIPKFRAWLKSVEEMVEVLEIDFYNKEVAYIWTEQVSDYELEQTREVDKFSDVILMQSTGLKDKNGVEIYEGDVLTLKYPHDRRYTVTAKVIRGTQISAMALKFEDDFTTEEIPLYKISAEHNFEVIGNIWEDGDLLDSE